MSGCPTASGCTAAARCRPSPGTPSACSAGAGMPDTCAVAGRSRSTPHRQEIHQRDTEVMPELPEVETVRRGLLATVLGRRVESVEVLSKQSLAAPGPALDRQLVGRRLAAVARRGKLLIVDLDSDAHLWVHLM